MADSKLHFYTLSNGLNIIVEPLQDVNSAAFSMFIPTGTTREGDNRLGLANVMTECLTKGAGTYDAKQLSEECERIGFHKSISCGMEASSFSGSVIADNIEKALELSKVILLEPTFPENELDSIKSLVTQDIDAIEDEPSSKVMDELSKVFYPHPFNRSTLGTKESVESCTITDIKDFYSETFGANGAVLGVSGRVNPETIFKCVEKLFGSWSGGLPLLPEPKLEAKNQITYLHKDNAQVQIALAYPSIGLEDPMYYPARVGVNVLSGGMSGRLFVEVREKRGLVYRVGAHHSASRGRSAIISSAGTTPENADETLKVMLEQLDSLKDGVTDEELHRAKVDLKTRLIMQGESTSARASTITSDWWNLGRVRSLSEIKGNIEKITNDDIVAYAKTHPVKGISLAVLGSKNLSLGEYAR